MADLVCSRWTWDDWGRLPGGYARRLAEVELGTYWHLYYQGTRVNGGLAASEDSAVAESRRLAWVHLWSHDSPRASSELTLPAARALLSGEDPPDWEWDD